MVEGIILAAGTSSRADSFKMELKLGEKTIIERSVESMYSICNRIIIVGGYRFDRLQSILKDVEKVVLVENSNYNSGMFGSVKEGLKKITSERFFILPGDCPNVQPETYKYLLQFKSEIIIPIYNAKKGHPILLNSSLIPEILNEPIDSSMRNYIQRKGFEPVEVDDPGILIDIDTLDDYKNLLNNKMNAIEH